MREDAGAHARDGASGTVYYNGACPVCRAGIESQRRRMEACGVSDIAWIDVHAHPDAALEVGTSLEAVRERLHVRAADGHIDVGADAFARLWALTPGQRWGARLLRVPGVGPAARLAYDAFARLLYRWNRARKHW